MNTFPLKLDLPEAQCVSLELQFTLDLPDETRRELALLGSREADQEDFVYFHEDYRNPSAAEGQKLHSWAEVHLVESGESDVLVEYLVESELEDQSELHHTDFTLSHLFSALEGIKQDVTAFFTLRFDLGNGPAPRFLRLLPYDVGLDARHSIEYRGAHLRVRTLQKDEYDLWFDLRPDDTIEATVRFSLKEPPAAGLPGHGLSYGREALGKLLAS